MTLEEIKEKYEIGEVRPPKKGELFVHIGDYGNRYDICEAPEDFKALPVRIVKEK